MLLPFSALVLHIGRGECGGIAGVFVFSPVVGYTSKNAEQGKFIIIGAQFEGIADGTMKINDLVSGLTGVDYDSDDIWLTTAAQIQVPATTGGYTTYRYLNDGWYDDNGEDAYKPGWCDGGGNIVDDEFTLCVAQWLKSVQDSANANVSGAVSEDSSASSARTRFQ